jgi:endonuclease/exonuclease/phosphatase (EEP) superfamily protein YafD
MTETRTVFRVAAANLAYNNSNVADATRVIDKLDAQVLVILEWTGTNIGSELLSDSSWQAVLDEPRRSAHGVLVLVRRPLEATAALVPAPVEGPCPIPVATVRLRLGSEWVGLLGIHAPPPIPTCMETNAPTLSALAELVEDGRLAEDLGTARRGDRLVMAGDFNALPRSPGMTRIRASGLVDTYSDRHWRPTGTWTSANWILHLIRIDYVLASRDLPVVGSWAVDLPGSDHRAVVADLDLSR